jgi:hypothetical protein
MEEEGRKEKARREKISSAPEAQEGKIKFRSRFVKRYGTLSQYMCVCVCVEQA